MDTWSHPKEDCHTECTILSVKLVFNRVIMLYTISMDEGTTIVAPFTCIDLKFPTDNFCWDFRHPFIYQ